MGLALHLSGVPCDPRVPLARFSSFGPNGDAPWHKEVEITAAEAAKLAGHSRAAEVLQLIEAGVPLFWSRPLHARTPDDFRASIRDTICALARTPWFLGLPGSARVRVVETLCESTLRERVWHMVTPDEWAALEDCRLRKLAEAERPDIASIVAHVESPPRAASGDEAGRSGAHEIPSYNFRIVHRVRQHWPAIGKRLGKLALRLLVRAACHNPTPAWCLLMQTDTVTVDASPPPSTRRAAWPCTWWLPGCPYGRDGRPRPSTRVGSTQLAPWE